MGFPAEASQVIYPVGMFLSGSDLTPIEEKIDELVTGLTKWKPKAKKKKVITPPKVSVKGKDYEEAFTNVNKLFLRNMWSDGLPIIPPTEERVNWLLTGTELSPDKVVAISDPRSQHQSMNATTCSVYPVVIVNGPVAKQIRLGSGYGCLGPDPLYPAGASIGRAIRFLLQDAGGAIPGIGTMSIYGGPARYTNIVFAEDEDALPSGWEPLNVEQGFSRGSNIVTTYAVASTTNIFGAEAGDEEQASLTLYLASKVMGIPNRNYWMHCYNPEGAMNLPLFIS